MARALVFGLAGLQLALTEQDCEVMPRAPVTRLPQADPLLLGLSAVHGRAVPLVNLARLLDRPTAEAELMIVIRLGQESVALPADVVYGLTDLPPHTPGAGLLGDALALAAPEPLPATAQPLSLQPLLGALRAHLERV
ncbi:chemotaxis protein CheW [Deinococcus koreensis]|uniref:chemotaxis protein CheW n=1 Tax=Deinococcus koreensis TaxID=2054903 RepID=UPI0013FDAEFD|nr:chemotaxis protein CheW [Deinococcus koreensis]